MITTVLFKILLYLPLFYSFIVFCKLKKQIKKYV